MIVKNRIGLAALLLAATALGADGGKRTIDAGGLTFEVPEAWESQRPASSMRRAQVVVKPAEGDADPAELTVFAFPGGAGTVEANVARWRDQFQDESGKAPPIKSDTRKGKNTDVTFVEVAGRYVAAVMPGAPQRNDKPNYRLLGAIVQTPQAAFFLKMVGPDATMKAAKPAFDELIASMKVEGK